MTDSLKAWLEKQAAVHQSILDTHTICPRQFHHGAIHELEKTLEYLSQHQTPDRDLLVKLEEMRQNWASYGSPHDVLGEVIDLVREHTAQPRQAPVDLEDSDSE